MEDTRPDEVSVATASALIGVTERRFRQLAAEGYVVIHRRGFTTVGSAVSGYVRSLRAEGETSAASAAAARQHGAKAQLVRSHTARRRAALTARAEAEEVITAISDAAIRRLKDARLPRALPSATGQSFASEVAAACQRIEAARDRALLALRTGDLSELDGGRDG